MDLFIKLVNGESIEQTVMSNVCVIGRSSKCDVVVPHEGMSRLHCQIEVEEGQVFITDLGSTNGVIIDGEKIQPHTRTPYQTYLSLSFGAVQSMQIELDDGKIGVDRSQTDNTVYRQANLTRTITRTMKETPKAEATVTRDLPSLPKDNKMKIWAMNVIAILILGGAVYWYLQGDNDPTTEEYSDQSNIPEETIDRF